MTSKQRTFPQGLAELLKLKTHSTCANPRCDAPVRHIDHITPVEQGGATTADNGQGTCEACNHAKQAPGWHQTPIDTGPGGVETITPTGHRYRSHAPPLPEPARPDWISEIERTLRVTIDDYMLAG
nr:HNH endonuclease signature motif containing protein [Nocardioides thalensis]